MGAPEDISDADISNGLNMLIDRIEELSANIKKLEKSMQNICYRLSTVEARTRECYNRSNNTGHIRWYTA
jgi:prefoldin subunit 5